MLSEIFYPLKILWRRKRQPITVPLPRKSHGRRSLVSMGYLKESERTERTSLSLSSINYNFQTQKKKKNSGYFIVALLGNMKKIFSQTLTMQRTQWDLLDKYILTLENSFIKTYGKFCISLINQSSKLHYSRATL